MSAAKMKIVLAGNYGTCNLGDQGMLVVLRERLLEQHQALMAACRAAGDVTALEEPQITVLSRHPSARYDETYGVTSLADLHDPSGGRGRWFHGFNRGDSNAHLLAIRAAIAEADVLVLGGGRIHYDLDSSFMRGGLRYFTELVTLAKFHNTPVVLFALTVVPVRSDEAREHLRFLAENAEVITVRENPSRSNLADLGIDPERIHVLPDPALGLPYLEGGVSYGGRMGEQLLSEAVERLRSLEVDPDQPLIGVNVRSYAWRDGAEGASRTEEQLAALLDQVIDQCDGQLLFLLQETYGQHSGDDDDRDMSRRVIERMEYAHSCFSVEDELSLWQALGLYRQCSMVLSMRRHGLVFALTQRVPVVSIGLDPNSEFLISSLGLSQNSVSLAPAKLTRSVEVIEREMNVAPESMGPLFAHVEESAARTRLYVDLIRDCIESEA